MNRPRSAAFFLMAVLAAAPLHTEEPDHLHVIRAASGMLPDAAGPEAGATEAASRSANELVLLASLGRLCELSGLLVDLATQRIHVVHKQIGIGTLLRSTQDRPGCMFTPTCSNYALQAIRKYGFARGFLRAVDRLQRCNGWGRELYPVDLRSGKLVDPP